MINSENFQALNLLQARYVNQVKCVYIDPPYNTGNDGFIYKDNYQHSSWLSMMEDRLRLGRELLADDGALFVSVDDSEQAHLKLLLDTHFGTARLLGTIIWQKKYAPANDSKDLAYTHDYVVAYSNISEQAIDQQRAILNRLPRDSDVNTAYKNPDADLRGPWKAGDYTSNKSAEERPNLFYAIHHPLTGEEIWPSRRRAWAYTREKHQEHLADNRVWWGADNTSRMPSYKRFLSEVRDLVPSTIWNWEEVGHTDEAKKELNNLFQHLRRFETPKATRLLMRIAQLATSPNPVQIVLDFFAGSGTTGHAIINLNREDGGQRKYILVEMGDYFDTVLKPRIQKAIYAKDWRDGKPISTDGVDHFFRYFTLESYDDTLNNLTLTQTPVQGRLLEASPDLREEYLLRYLLDAETQGSPSLLNHAGLATPFDYYLTVTHGGERRAVPVDLPETFNLLLGLRVRRIRRLDGFHTVEGRAPDDARVLIIWRTLTERDDAALTAFFAAQGYGARTGDEAFSRIYVNGDNTLDRVRRAAESWQVLLIEDEFARLMWAETV